MPVEEEAGLMLNPDGFSDFVMLTFQAINSHMFLSLWQHKAEALKRICGKKRILLIDLEIGVNKNKKYGGKKDIG